MRFSLLLFLFLPAFIFSQKKSLTLEDAVLRQNGKLNPKRPRNLLWVPGTDEFSYVQKNTLRIISTKNGKETSLSLEKINEELTGENPLPSFPPVQWISKDSMMFSVPGRDVKLHRNGRATINEGFKFPDEAENIETAANGNISFNIANNVFVVIDNKTQKQITNDGSYEIVNGRSVHRDEFGIHKGMFWSNSGNLLAFYRMDQSMVTDYPILDITQKPASPTMIKYPMAGERSHHVTVGVYNISAGKTTFLNTGAPQEQYLTNIAWSPDDKIIYIVIVNREQNHTWLNAYDATTGEFIKTLFEDKHEKYVQPLHPIEFVKGNKDLFIHQSAVSGFNKLLLYNTAGKLVRTLSPEKTEVTDILGFTKDGKRIIYQAASSGNWNGRDLFVTEISNGKTVKLTQGDGTYSGKLSSTGEFIAVDFTSTNVPAKSYIINLSGRTVRSVAEAPNPLADYALGSLSVFTIPASDNTPLYCRLITPPDFDSTKKYPVMVYVYGGPGAQLITNTWLAGNDLFLYYMASKGFVVFTLENRGSEGRGKTFEQATFRELGKVEMEDQLRGVDYLKTKSYVDANRMGIYGWSFGGFMATSLMTQHPGVFKAAVAGGPVIDWRYYEVMYTERYMDTPKENPEGYEKTNLLNYVGNLNGKLMLIHGTSDDVVVWQHSLMYVKKAVEARKQIDYFVYPGHLHNVRGKDRVHLLQKISEYFIENL